MAQMKRFDPEAHLTKQGWKGKGTALKHGHLTRPLPVVVKKTLSGIGKDRDEAIPFWDNIFAATAASIITNSNPTSTNASPLPSGAATPVMVAPDAAPRTTLSTSARVGQEVARRGLYSRFFRGKPHVEEVEIEEKLKVRVGVDVSEAGPSAAVNSTNQTVETQTAKGKGKAKERNETKEERRARRAEKSRRKEERAAKKASKAEKLAEKESNKASDATVDVVGASEKKRKRRKEAEEEVDSVTEAHGDKATPGKEKEKKKRKKKE